MKKYALSLTMLTIGATVQAEETKQAATKTAVTADAGVKFETANLKIGFVDPYRALELSDEWKDEQQKMQAELTEQIKNYQQLEESFRAKQQELQSMGNAASEAARKTKERELSELQKKIMIERQMLEESSNTVMQEAQMKVLKKVEEVVGEISREEGLDLVHGMGIVFASSKVDLTQKVVERMNSEYAKRKAKAKPTTASQPTLKTAQNTKDAPKESEATTNA